MLLDENPIMRRLITPAFITAFHTDCSGEAGQSFFSMFNLDLIGSDIHSGLYIELWSQNYVQE